MFQADFGYKKIPEKTVQKHNKKVRQLQESTDY